jgi:hypothetical protein
LPILNSPIVIAQKSGNRQKTPDFLLEFTGVLTLSNGKRKEKKRVALISVFTAIFFKRI